MAPKPASTAGKAPASTASKAPAKTTADKAAKKTKAAPVDGEKKKSKRRVRKETYSSYIYKGTCFELRVSSHTLNSLSLCSAQAGAPRHWYLQQGDGHPQLLR